MRTIFSDRLKKMKEASKPGAIPPSAAVAKIGEYLSLIYKRKTAFNILLKTPKTKPEKLVSLLMMCFITFTRFITLFLGHMSPIIMISSSPTSLVTMYNVRKFLQESA